MSAIRHGAGATRANTLNEAVSERRWVYPLLMIGGVYRASFAMGLAVYALPACAASPSRHRARLHLRRARRAFRQTMTQPGADVSPRPDETRIRLHPADRG